MYTHLNHTSTPSQPHLNHLNPSSTPAQPSQPHLRFVYRNFTDRFIDPSLIQYAYTVSEVPADGNPTAQILKGPINITGLANTPITVPNLALDPGRRYAVAVTATNPANKVGVASGQVLVETSSQGAVQLALGLSLGLVALFVLVTGLLVWFYLRRCVG